MERVDRSSFEFRQKEAEERAEMAEGQLGTLQADMRTAREASETTTIRSNQIESMKIIIIFS